MLARELHDDVSQRLAVLAIDVGRAEFAAAGGAHVEGCRPCAKGLSVSARTSILSPTSCTRPSSRSWDWQTRCAPNANGGRRQGRINVSVEIDAMPARRLKGRGALSLQGRPRSVDQRGAPRRRTMPRPSSCGNGRWAAPRGRRRRLRLRSRRSRQGDAARPGEHARTRATGGGTFEIESAPGQGTAVVAWVPVSRRRGTVTPRASASAARRRPPSCCRGAEEPAQPGVRPRGGGGGRPPADRGGRALRPDVIVADITMPHLNGIDALVRLREEGDRTRRVPHDAQGRDLRPARARGGSLGLRAQALGVGRAGHSRSRRVRGQDVPDAAAGGRGPRGHETRAGAGRDPVTTLTPRQREVLQLVAEGRSAKEIARSLSISVRTVEYHKYQLMETLGLHTTAELIHFALKHGSSSSDLVWGEFSARRISTCRTGNFTRSHTPPARPPTL